MIKFKCASCDKVYQLPDNAAGRKARCKVCGEAMIVPDAPDELFDDSPATSDDLTALYSSTESSDVIDHSAAPEDPMAFNPETSFQQSTHKSAPPLPMKLILAGAGGALGLILVVVVIIVVMSGNGSGDQADSSDDLAFNPTSSGTSERPTTDSPSGSGNGSTSLLPEPDPVVPDPIIDPVEPDPIIDPVEPDPVVPDPVEPDPVEPTPITEEPDEEDPPVVVENPEPVAPTPASPAGLIAPTSTAYGIVLPAELEMISQTRVAVRTAPHADGTWLSMEVHKLAGMERRQASPIAADGATVLLRGRRVAMPAGVQVSEVASDQFAIQRLLYPKKKGQETRRVEYVIKDGPFLISVLGRYPEDDEAKLAMLDEAAKSVQPVEDQ